MNMEQRGRAPFREDDFAPARAGAGEAEALARTQSSYIKDVWRTFRKNRAAAASLAVMGALVFLVLLGPQMVGFDYFSNDYGAANRPPDGVHWFGTDALGRDLWARVWVGGRVSLLIAILGTLIPEAIGIMIGGISGYFGGKLDMFIMRSIDVLMGIPSLIYIILLMIVLGSGNILTLVIAVSVTGWMGSARGTRGLVLQLKSREFIASSETLGARAGWVITKHLLPNVMGIRIVSITMSIPSVIFYEAFLSYIGLGVVPPNPSWGQLIKSAGETFRYYPYQFIIPCLFVSLSMLCFNLVGDGLRDALDPKLRS